MDCEYKSFVTNPLYQYILVFKTILVSLIQF